MDHSFASIIKEIKQLIINPKGFWADKKDEKKSTSLFVGYLLPLLLLLSIAVFLGEFFRRSDFFFEYPIFKTVREILLFVSQYFLGVFFTKELMKTFGGEKDTLVARKLVAYSMIPLVLVSIFTGLFEYFNVLKVLGFYSFYIFWLGTEALVDLPKEKEHKYAMIVIFINLLVFSFLGWALTKVFEFILYSL